MPHQLRQMVNTDSFIFDDLFNYELKSLSHALHRPDYSTLNIMVWDTIFAFHPFISFRREKFRKDNFHLQ